MLAKQRGQQVWLNGGVPNLIYFLFAYKNWHSPLQRRWWSPFSWFLFSWLPLSCHIESSTRQVFAHSSLQLCIHSGMIIDHQKYFTSLKCIHANSSLESGKIDTCRLLHATTRWCTPTKWVGHNSSCPHMYWWYNLNPQPQQSQWQLATIKECLSHWVTLGSYKNYQ